MGRPKGARSLATIERERVAAEIAQRTVMDAKPTGKRLAKEVLYEFMMTFANMASFYQPTTQANLTAGGLIENPHTDEPMFLKYANLTVDTAAKLAPYESPTFKSVPVPGSAFMPEMKTIDQDGVIDLNDANAVARVYRRMMTADD